MIARGTEIIAVVAQLPGGASGNLATLVPVLFQDGSLVESGDFPENDLVFWSVRSRDSAATLSPGTIILASVEESDEALLPKNPADRHIYRTEFGSVRAPAGNEVCEVLLKEASHIQHPRDLLGPNQFVLNHRPTPRAYVETNESFYGPFLAEARPTDDTSAYYAINLKPLNESVDIIPRTSVLDLGLIKELSAVVSLRSLPPNRSNQTIKCSYRILTEDDLSALKGSAKQTVPLRTPDQILRPLIRRFYQLGKFRAVSEHFDEFVNLYAESQTGSSPLQQEIIEAIRDSSSNDKRLLREMSDSLIASGLLADALEERIRGEADAYITAKTTELSAQIRSRLQEEQKNLDNLERTLSSRQSEFDSQLREQRNLLNDERLAFEAQKSSELRQITSERVELNNQRQTVARYLEGTVNRFRDDRESVIGELLTILPLLDAGRLEPTSSLKTVEAQNENNETQIEFPEAVRKTRGQFANLKEEEFFARFCGHVESSGFKYREIDLLSFHLNFKTTDFFVLGGMSGTGKSSLPQLYAEAIAGDANDSKERLLRIPVNPTWLEVSDVLGRVNMIDRTFNPGESGLVRHLIYCAMEYQERGQDSGFWPIVLDEMNLAQVEHYLGPFVQMFGSEQAREIRIFDPVVVKRSDPFWPWGILKIQKTTRFIGTINFDETTRPLSPRLLDRAAIMSMGTTPQTGSVQVSILSSGQPILQRNLDEWSSSNSLSQSEAAFLDSIQAELSQLGCPLNPRRRKAIERFRNGATGELCSAETALDLIVSQRILPLIRGVFRPLARNAFDVLASKVSNSSFNLPESERVLNEFREREEAGVSF